MLFFSLDSISWYYCFSSYQPGGIAVACMIRALGFQANPVINDVLELEIA